MTIKPSLTIDDIARELGVSKTTVSRAISGKGRISAATRERVLAYIEEHNYKPNASAKSLAESKTYNLALALPRDFIKLDIPFIRQTMSAIVDEAYTLGYNVMMCLDADTDSTPLMRTLDYRKVDGVILTRTVEDDHIVEMLIKRGIPYATLGSLPHKYSGTALVEADHDQSGGCRAFSKAILSGSDAPTALLGNDLSYIVNQSRLAGFTKAAAETAFPADCIQLRTNISSYRDCALAVQELLSLGVRRFLAMDDDICVNILRTLEATGRVTPGDVEICSLADSDRLDAYRFPVAALRFDAAELGQIACRELLRCLRNESYDSAPLLGYRIINR